MNRFKFFAVPGIVPAGFVVSVMLVASAGFNPVHAAEQPASVPKWGRFETTLESSTNYPNPTQDAKVGVLFEAPSGKSYRAYGFWDGGHTWRLRFSPDETGKWSYRTACSDTSNAGLQNQSGTFQCTAAEKKTRFTEHGPLKVSPDGRYLMHEDGTPFFWLADTAWNGPLLSSDEDWNYYLKERTRQKFDAVQFVTTQWRAAPDGDRQKHLAYTGTDKLVINPEFFQRLDKKIDALNEAGLLAVPVMLWDIAGGSNPKINPGVSLPDDQAVLLARYMVGRWGANAVVWILAGDGNYRGEKAARWKRIGRAVFEGLPHAPVTMHPGGMQWVWKEFKDEDWYDIVGYQSGHGDDDNTLKWLIEGPMTEDYARLPHRPFINLEPPYEGHLGYQSKKPLSAEHVRRALYWSLLNAPTAGVSYGAHGVWGWDDGTKPPTDHPNTGTPKPWKEALKMPAAEQMPHLYDFFASVDWWRLSPASMFIVNQPGKQDPRKFIAAGRTYPNDLMVIYVPEDRTVEVKLDAMPPSPQVTWFNPRTGEKSPAVGVVTTSTCQFPSPAEGDWILYMYTQTEKEKAKAKAADKPAEKPAEKPEAK